MISRAIFFVGLGLAAVPALAADSARNAITDCDRMAANSNDQDRPRTIAAVPFDKFDAHTAIMVCRAALTAARAASGPQATIDLRRVQYELGRALEATSAFTEAKASFEAAAEAGSVRAMAELGAIYEFGSGVEQNFEIAKTWHEKAALSGDVDSMSSLGYAYQLGRGVPQNYAAAKAWYEKAALAGQAYSMFKLGLLYESGHGVAQDSAAAKAWYEKAVANGHEPAIAALERIKASAGTARAP